MNKKDFNFYNGKNYCVLETEDYGQIVFGCPPDIIKEFIKLKKPLPSKYIFPLETFKDGQNNFDFEFIVYSFLFTRAKESTINAYCRPVQEKRFRAILNETLFGPKFNQILTAQNYKIFNEKKFDENDRKRFKVFLRRSIANNKSLPHLFDSLLNNYSSESLTIKKIKQFFEEKILPNHHWIVKKNIKNLPLKLAKNYALCAQLRKEFQLFSLASESERNSFISKIIKFHHIKKSGFFLIPGKQNKRKTLKLQESDPGIFKVYENKTERCFFKYNSKYATPKKQKPKKFKIPNFGITFLGVGSGFSHDKRNSSVVIWAENKGILIDVVNDNDSILKNYGINHKNINHIFLTHVHSDHDAGILEKIFNSKKTHLISSRIIYESFLRKACAITSLSKNFIEKLIKFTDVEPNKKIKIPGFKKTFFEFDYSLHSIPTGRCKITNINGINKKSISHSGDTKYDIQKINTWFDEGAFTNKRKNSITGFIWDSDLIVHDAGGGNLHTNYESLLHLNNEIKNRIILVHQNEKPHPKSQLRYAFDGETIVVI